MEEVIDAVKTYIGDRLKSPYFAAVIAVWIATNRVIVFGVFNFEESLNINERVLWVHREFESFEKLNIFFGFYGTIFWSLTIGVVIMIGFNLVNSVTKVIYHYINIISTLMLRSVRPNDYVSNTKYEKEVKKSIEKDAQIKKAKEDIDSLEKQVEDANAKNKNLEERSNVADKSDEQKINNNMGGLFEGKWRNDYITNSIEGGVVQTGSVEVVLKEGAKYYEKGKHCFNLDMIEVNRERKFLRFRKVGLKGDPRRVVNDLRIISDVEYRGIEEENTIITYTRIDGLGQELEFRPFYTKEVIKSGEETEINFEIFNNRDISIETRSYQFNALFNGLEYWNGPEKDYNEMVAPGEKKILSWGTIDPLRAYFNGKADTGTLDSEITLKYKFSGQSDTKVIVRKARLMVVG